MKKYCTILLIFVSTLSSGQSVKQAEQNLSKLLSKINYWAFSHEHTENVNPYDSLEAVNDRFEKLLLQYTKSIPQTLSYGFKKLADSGLIVSTSEDGLFRIYSWDTWTGGTMHVFRNIFQYKSDGKVFSKAGAASTEEDGTPGVFYYQVNDVVSQNKTFYITQSRAILSSGLTWHNIQVFSIDGTQLNDDARLIKTKTGIKNQLGYEVDLTAASNREREVPEYYIEYDKATKTFSIPVILEDGKVTAKKIRYRFTGKYFEKI